MAGYLFFYFLSQILHLYIRNETIQLETVRTHQLEIIHFFIFLYRTQNFGEKKISNAFPKALLENNAVF
jgi:hypothetical protein